MSRHHRRLRRPSAWEMRHIKRSVVHLHGLVCWLCRGPIASYADVTLDHMTPASRGGLYEVDNLRPAHHECNQKRGTKPPWEAMPPIGGDQ